MVKRAVARAKLLVLIDPGHGFFTYGKRCLKSLDPNETREWVLNDRIADALILRLEQYEDVEYARLDDPSGKRDVPLQERIAKANKLYAEYTKKGYTVIILSLHHNAGIYGGKGGGLVTFADSRKASARTIQIRDRVYDNVLAQIGLRGNRANPKTTAPLYMLNRSYMPGTLIEFGFMDAPADIGQILSASHPRQCADGIINFLVADYGLAKKVTAVAPKPVEDLADYAYTTDNLNVRAGRSTGHKVLATYPKGTKVNPLYLANGWWSIAVPLSVDKRGYAFVHADYLSKTSPIQPVNKQGVVSATRGLNVRSGPNAGYAKVGTLKNNELVTIYAERSGWYRIGTDRWVSAKFIKE